MHIVSKRALVLMNFSAFFSGMVFYAPVATLYRQARGLDLAQIALIEAICLSLTMALEIPWGYIADRIGHRLTLVLSFFLLFVSKIVFFNAYSFPVFVFERILLALANSAASGVDTAYLARFDSRQETYGIYHSFQFAGLVMVACIFPFFKDVFASSAFWTIVTNALAFVCIMLLPRERPQENGLPQKEAVPLLAILIKVLKDWHFLIFVGSVSLLFSVNQIVTVFLVQVRYKQVGLGDSFFGYPFLALVIVSFLASLVSAKITKFLGRGNALSFFFALAVLGLFMLTLKSGFLLVLLGALLLRFGASGVVPLVLSIEARQAEGKQSATILSIYALVSELIELVLTVILGILADKNLQLSLLVAGGFVFLGLVALHPKRRFPFIA
ncbi:arabinose efflux permease family protein [Sphaerochaeta pleomorpha str. Grapes]|uniref:Arabinose efflux permease family protein n=1 Tax=Sphaerochaeta pleomorpha (strain ATCC BAA-1885 / DSM 22778 / Grapes) TaxID=158190 RepID=G8QVD6_SPHPG|nr:MFS transporter [Sphaerochaeta pleomorpha]AEV30451.1 arabinose efflux permease family protein [Sphaerochaeta pleomorpha str. Grapes]